MTTTISNSWKFLEVLGAKIEYSGNGKVFVNWDNNDVRHKKYKFIVTYNNQKFISTNLEGLIKHFLKIGIIDKSNIIENGHKICGRCGGEGKVKYGCDGGWCFKCYGEGILYK